MSIYDIIKQRVESSYTPDQYPALFQQIEYWGVSKPLKGLEIVDVTPIFNNTLTKYLPLLASGAKLNVGISESLPNDQKIIQFIKSIGVNVVNLKEASKHHYDIVLDCAGAFSKIESNIGYVELTRSGIEHYKNCSKPVFAADSGKIKRIETMLGTGESLFRALKKLGQIDFKNKKIVVFGSGKVGSGIILYGAAQGANMVTITDPRSIIDSVKNKCKVIDYKNITSIIKEVSNANFIITATGIKNAISNSKLAKAISDSPATLANMGVEDEFGEHISDDRILNQNRPINFILEEPTHLKYIETTMALHNEGALELLSNRHKIGIYQPNTNLEKRLLKVVSSNGLIAKELELIDF